MIQLDHHITDPLGMHLQLAVLLSSEAQRWRSKITLKANGGTTDAKDLLALLNTALRSQQHIRIEVSGPDEQTASQSIQALITTF